MGQLEQILAIVGPTAAGKTAAGIAVAREIGGEIVCADARTVYRGMDIGTAKPKGEPGGFPGTRMVEAVRHWCLDLVTPAEPCSAADFVGFADAAIAEIIKQGKTPIVVGGTGLYIDTLVGHRAMASVPPNPELRARFLQRSLPELVEELARQDPQALELVDVRNRRRVERALEIVLTTGQPLAAARATPTPRYAVQTTVISPPREELFARIDARVEAMMEEGWLDEVRGLVARYGRTAPGMTAIGYRDLAAHLARECSLDDAIAAIKKATRSYARRQMTWLRRDTTISYM